MVHELVRHDDRRLGAVRVELVVVVVAVVCRRTGSASSARVACRGAQEFGRTPLRGTDQLQQVMVVYMNRCNMNILSTEVGF